MAKQYCLTLPLKGNEKLISEYEKRHQPGQVWPEIIAGIHN